MKIKKILIKDDKKMYWQEKDMHTQYGYIKEAILKKSKNGKIKTHLGKELIVMDALFLDNLEKIKRGPAIILPKDIGLILTLTSIDKNSIVLDAGTGCGVLASFLGRFCKKVYSYERNPEFFKLAKENLKNLNIKNVILKNNDVYESIDEKNIELIVLDLPEPWKALNNVKKALKSSRYLVCYLPTINQVAELLENSKDFMHERTLELIYREWQTDITKLRPKSQIIGHTGFLVFLRKI
ncbi:methyltransferase domain-containing protein [Candidatus Woesearchaeota archaeon]|nr:methyltransferase domain-containing protein [Candidatus Woesearchaeota archaeon]